MKIYQKIRFFEKSLRTGLLFVCMLSAACMLTGCGREDKLLSGLQEESWISAGEGLGGPADGCAETAGVDAGTNGSGNAGQDAGTEGLQSVGEDSSGKEMSVPGQNAAAKEGLEAEEQPKTETIYVHVCGEVETPGVYELPAGSRFYEAVEAAGGYTAEACRDYLNMAAPLADGSRLEIPSKEAAAEREKSRSKSGEPGGKNREEESSYYTLPEGGDSAPDQTDGGNAGASEGLVNINTADIAGLCALPGIGEGRAKAIIEYREKQGGFQKKEDIMQVSGIGEKMYARMEAYLTVE